MLHWTSEIDVEKQIIENLSAFSSKTRYKCNVSRIIETSYFRLINTRLIISQKNKLPVSKCYFIYPLKKK